MNPICEEIDLQDLRTFTIVAAAEEASRYLADLLEETLQIRLPVVSPEAFSGEHGIYVGTREFQNYGGYRCCVALENGNLYLDGGTDGLFRKAAQMLVDALCCSGIRPGRHYGYCWLNGEVATGLQLRSGDSKLLCPGVTYCRRSYVNGNGEPVEAFILVADKNSPAKPAVWGSPQGQSQTVPEHVAQMRGLGKDVIAAVNADFFHFFHNGDKTTFGAQIIDGVVYKEPNNAERYGENWFGVTLDGEYVLSDLESYREQYQGKLWQAVGGGYWVMREQKICVPNHNSPDPRTAIALTKDGDLVLVCIDGRSSASIGATITDTLQVFLDLDLEIRTVLNLDGGHSTIMMGKQENGEMAILNQPSSGLENLRPIADILTLVLPGQA